MMVRRTGSKEDHSQAGIDLVEGIHSHLTEAERLWSEGVVSKGNLVVAVCGLLLAMIVGLGSLAWAVFGDRKEMENRVSVLETQERYDAKAVLDCKTDLSNSMTSVNASIGVFQRQITELTLELGKHEASTTIRK